MTRCCAAEICSECFCQIKRADPTPTHLVVRLPIAAVARLTAGQSEPVSCPFCVEPEFGVTYDPPAPALQRTPSGSRAFASVPDPPAIERSPSSASGSGIVLKAPLAPPGRRKSRSATEPSVVTVDRIHPNWQAKLEAARATAARRAARRIVFRRVEDGRLVPVGITSARDIAAAAYAAEHGGEAAEPVPSRRSGRRRPTDGSSYLQSLGMSGTDLEELMMAEAMRLSIASVQRAGRPLALTL